MKCHKCGYELPATAKFCRFCGAIQNQTPETVTPPPIPAPVALEAAGTQSLVPKSDISAVVPSPVIVQPPITTPEAPVVAAKPVVTQLPLAASKPSAIAPRIVQSKAVHFTAAEPITSQAAVSVPKSKTGIFAAMGIFVVVAVGGVRYWEWTQKKAADEQTALVAKQQVEEQKRKADEEQQRKLKEAEEKGHKEAEEKAKQELQDKVANAQAPVQPTPQPAVDDILERASKCENILECIVIMFQGVDPRQPEAIQAVAKRIGELNKAQRGDRKIARDLNKKGLDEFKQSNFGAAIDLLKKAAVADPADVEIASNLGFVALRANNNDVAIQALSSALLLDARRTSSWVSMAECFTVKKNSDAAVRALLLAYEFSANKEKSMTFFEDKANTAEREAMRPMYASAIQKIKAGLNK